MKAEDSSVLESITLRKNPANGELSKFLIIQPIQSMTKDLVITNSFGKYSCLTKYLSVKSKIFLHLIKL